MKYNLGSLSWYQRKWHEDNKLTRVRMKRRDGSVRWRVMGRPKNRTKPSA